MSKRLGHATPIVTMTIYRHVFEEEDETARDVFSQAYTEQATHWEAAAVRHVGDGDGWR